MTMILFFQWVLFYNYIGFVLSVIDMAFKGLHDEDPLDPSVLVL